MLINYLKNFLIVTCHAVVLRQQLQESLSVCTAMEYLASVEQWQSHWIRIE
jgi:hypothetical protein